MAPYQENKMDNLEYPSQSPSISQRVN